MLNAFCWYLSLDSFTAKTKGNFQPDRVTSVAASMPNNDPLSVIGISAKFHIGAAQ